MLYIDSTTAYWNLHTSEVLETIYNEKWRIVLIPLAGSLVPAVCMLEASIHTEKTKIPYSILLLRRFVELWRLILICLHYLSLIMSSFGKNESGILLDWIPSRSKEYINRCGELTSPASNIYWLMVTGEMAYTITIYFR